MHNKIIALVIALLPFAMQAQNLPDSVYRQEMDKCNDRVFSKVEKPPYIIKGRKFFEDSLTTYLKANHAYNNNMRATYSFMLTTAPYITGVHNDDSKDGQFDELVIRFLTATRLLWKPASQNGRDVCALVDLVLIVRDGRLNVLLSQ